MNTFEWQNGTVVERPYVVINGTKYYVQDGSISGGTPATANNLNEMQDILNANILDVYSESELKTNKIWINDKPIYRKVFVLNSLPNTSTYSIDISSLNIESIVSINGFTNTGLVFNGNRTSSTTSQIDLYADITRNNIDVTTYSDRSNLSGHIILEYTKIS